MTAPPIADGAVAVRDGRILHVGDRSWVVDQLDGRPFTERRWTGALLPGLVNAHSHLQYTGMAGVGQRQYRGFEDWAAAFNADYAQPHDWRAEADAGARASIAAGVTSIADVVTDIEAADVLEANGLGGIAYWEVMDWENQAWQERGRTQVLDELARIPTTPGAGLSPHAPYSLDVAPLLELPDIVRQRGLRLHLHLGEAAFEGERIALGPVPGLEGVDGVGHTADWHLANVPSFRAMRALGFGASATAFVDRLGVLGPDCHIAHGVYVTAADRALLRARGTAVALCPRSNAVIGLDPPPVADYLREAARSRSARTRCRRRRRSTRWRTSPPCTGSPARRATGTATCTSGSSPPRRSAVRTPWAWRSGRTAPGTSPSGAGRPRGVRRRRPHRAGRARRTRRGRRRRAAATVIRGVVRHTAGAPALIPDHHAPQEEP